MSNSASHEYRGKNVEAAIRLGLSQLGLTEDEVDIQVINPGSRGILGIGAEDAVVVITPRPQTTPEHTAQNQSQPEANATPEVAVPYIEPAKTTPRVEVHDGEQRTGESDDLEAVARAQLEGLLRHLGVRAQVRSYYADPDPETKETPLVLDVVGNDLGVLIGRRGETLSALQYMVRLMVNRRVRRWTNIMIDVESYKSRRHQQLVQLALRMAERVATTGQAVTLEPMPPRERRIIHLTLRDHPSVTTESVGEGDKRKVTIKVR